MQVHEQIISLIISGSCPILVLTTVLHGRPRREKFVYYYTLSSGQFVFAPFASHRLQLALHFSQLEFSHARLHFSQLEPHAEHVVSETVTGLAYITS